MKPCRENLEDLALLAGGDVPEPTSHELRRHVATCEGCARMLGALEGDQSALAACLGQRLDLAPVMGSVMARIAADACLQPHGASVQRAARSAALVPFARAAAVVLVVVGAAVLGVASLHEGLGPAPASRSAQASPAAPGSVTPAASPAAGATEVPAADSTLASAAASSVPAHPSEEGLPMFVRRSGDGVLLTWAGDGRETRPAPGRPSTYKVLASATPAGFEDARPVEVAGSTLVASMGLPAARVDGRSITYFRVE